jgi:hypothetical protein
VDTIREEEKYGNEGDVLGGVGRAIVGGTEHLSVATANAVSVSYVLRPFKTSNILRDFFDFNLTVF